MSFTISTSQRHAVALACRRHHVKHMHLFGSAVRDDFQPGCSDLDWLVEFQSLEPTALVDAYFSLEQQLASILDQPVDLVMAGAIHNPHVWAEIQASKQLIYEA
ncbi:MAG: hypothetical protein F4Z75_05410 [Synechococcus sp. SB0668_bin_15]|nr:hypothetical protein [Synechococcus sp. SB0668_bin_15]MXZ82949.1 hypothetical protein [Synechococcus sp. SB0666_bin_14]MYA91347.1 hypothetical protein [Synechococcus sp. SB0663_bin_10]MYC49650.1 hypothetical protein [Synechococcus sp. SB0662_bin_14]MYG47393.1 hypothetical protein [Synechococcus sp. SB0675_bin_6]MYK91452.1 hypothetical protein [Synechococcus sp. SB0669_bin_8]